MEPFVPMELELDTTAVARLARLGGRDLVRRIVGLFLQNAPVRVAAAIAGYRTGDMAAVELAAHSLRSSAANVGAVVILGLATEIERHATDRELRSLPTLLDELAAAVARIRPELAAVISGGTS